MADINLEQLDKEILPFLSLSARPDVRSIAMQYFLGLTGKPEGINFIAENKKYLGAIISVLKDEQQAILKDAYLALVNLTTNVDLSWALLNLEEHPDFFEELMKYVMTEDSVNANLACMLLSNLSRWERCAERIIKLMMEKQANIGFDKLIQVFCKIDFNKTCSLHYLGPFLSNLTQTSQARLCVLDKSRCVLQRLLPYTQYMDSLVRRGGIVGTLRNCCFETAYHDWLLGESVDILPRLLLPLAGPEEFDDDDMEKLPEDLQFLEPDKEREPDPDVRKMLVESVHQLLATKPCRKYIRSKNAYVILRELDNWEKDPPCTAVIQNTVSILIADEPEPGMEDLSKVEIPSNVETKLQKWYDQQQAEVKAEVEKLEAEKNQEQRDSGEDDCKTNS